ncbi:MAG: hypothetical protein NT013_08825 [Planctomycetia bacterium]|nr:hypothetical protein [Planctomycetia bacterium]
MITLHDQHPMRSNNCMIDSNLFSTTIARLAAGVWVTAALWSIVV